MFGNRLDKTLFKDDRFRLFDNLDRTKIAQFQLSGITTGNTRTLTIPDASGTLLLSGDIGSSIQAHGGVLDDFNVLDVAASDGQFIVATGAGAFAYESGNTARTSLGLGTGDSPQFGGLTVTGTVYVPNLEATEDITVAGNITATGDITCDELTLTLGIKSNIHFGSRVDGSFYSEMQTAAKTMIYELFTQDGDATDDVAINLWLYGEPDQLTNRQVFQIIATSGEMKINTQAAGNQSVCPMILYAGANTNQLYLDTDGQVGIGKVPVVALDVNGDIVASGTVNASAGKMRVRDDAASKPSSESDGFISVYENGSTRRFYTFVGEKRYYVALTADYEAAPGVGNPIGLLLTLTYAA